MKYIDYGDRLFTIQVPILYFNYLAVFPEGRYFTPRYKIEATSEYFHHRNSDSVKWRFVVMRAITAEMVVHNGGQTGCVCVHCGHPSSHSYHRN